jgi:hypothetical protein
MVHIEMVRMYIPKKVKWNSLSELRDFLAKETTEKIVVFDGWRLITETTMYTMCDSKLFIDKPPKEKKGESKSTKGRPDGSTANKERMGTHGRSDNAKPDRKKASKVCASKVPKKVSKPKKSPK